jgi:aspartate racemase
MHHIGILQYSLEGAILCYREAAYEAMRRLGEHRHPLITMAGLSMSDTIEDWDAKNYVALRAGTAEVVERLARAGADFFVMPDNTAHIALEEEGPPLSIPGLHIGEVVASEASHRGYRKVGVLGTNWTMEGPVYPRALEFRGMEWAVPDATTRKELHRIIMDELCMGEFLTDSIATFQAAVEALRIDGCDAVALVCTEIPLILNDDNSALPVLDSTRLLAKAAVDVALGDRPLPTWRGGRAQG